MHIHFILSVIKSFETLPSHNKYDFMSESFALERYIFIPLTYKKLLLPL